MGTWSILVTMSLGGGASWAMAGDAKTSAPAKASKEMKRRIALLYQEIR